MEYTKDRKLTFEQQQELNRIRDGVIGKVCAGLTTVELNRLNPNLLKATPKLYELLKHPSGSSHRTDDPKCIWLRFNEVEYNEVLAEVES